MDLSRGYDSTELTYVITTNAGRIVTSLADEQIGRTQKELSSASFTHHFLKPVAESEILN